MREEKDEFMLRAWADAVIRFNLEVPGMGAPRRFMEILKVRGRPKAGLFMKLIYFRVEVLKYTLQVYLKFLNQRSRLKISFQHI